MSNFITGGYHIIDCRGIKIDDESGANIPGIYDQFEEATKPVMLVGVNNDGTMELPVFAPYYASSNIFYATLKTVYDTVDYTLTTTMLKVESDDDVSIISVTVGAQSE